MLLDNKTKTEDNDPYKVFDFIKHYTENGELDLVTGFFSVNALALMKDDINQVEKFRLILGNLMRDDAQLNKIIDLLNGDAGISQTLLLNLNARKAVEFLQQDKVSVKSIQRNFCHAKAYIYGDKETKNNFYIIGSSNLTDAGLGIKDSSNIELNAAATGNNNDYKELKKWFKHQWENVAVENIELPDKSTVDVKQHIIEAIKSFFKEYTPDDLYHKVLYELFKNDLLDLSSNVEFKREIARLEETSIYKALFPYQQKGAISLIKMLQKFNGAILADAVGLGKTWTTLAVIKHFELKGYSTVVFCPKKLRNNWEQYKSKDSRFKQDEIDYYIRSHTDLQDERLTKNHSDFPLHQLQRKQRLLLVIDESHNLRNDKSARYKFLVDNILLPRQFHEVKVLLLSATPINNGLTDIRNQFKLMAKGQDHGFKETELEIDSLENIFRTAQKDFAEWSEKKDRKIADLIAKLPHKFEKLTDALIVARTRKLIEGEFGEMNFPKKAEPVNEYITPENLGSLKTFGDILNALEVNLTAYQPSAYTENLKALSILEDPKHREKFLVKMMYILLIKRLESSWHSFKSTVENILNHHLNAAEKVNLFITKNQKEISLEDNFTDEEQEEIEETATETGTQNDQPITLGKKNPVLLSSITDIQFFKNHLDADIAKLTLLKANLDQYEAAYKEGKAQDDKLDKLIEHIDAKQKKSSNKKVLIFTVFKDTAKFLYDELKKKGISNLAFISGVACETFDEGSGAKFESILERFAPFTKLYNEKDWTHIYDKANLSEEYKEAGKWRIPYEKWLELIAKHDPKTQKKIDHPIDVLVATDCLSEGQNLQDCDMVVNYDIHWNPVRLIQRMGRIDRIGSPNKTIRGINFWPSKNYEDYLGLKSRVENRMALMSVAGTEVDDKMTPEFRRMVEENPLLSKQAQKMLDQFQNTLDDAEGGDETLGLNDFSLEQFRQELFEFFKKKEEFLKNIPNSVFTGFKFRPDKKWPTMPESIVAVLGYPKRPDEALNHVYEEIRLLHQNMEDGKKSILNNNQEILTFLRKHKQEARYVPKNIDKGDPIILDKLSEAIRNWLKAQTVPAAINQIQGLFTGDATLKISPDKKKLEDKFKSENFDLINWFIISNN